MLFLLSKKLYFNTPVSQTNSPHSNPAERHTTAIKNIVTAEPTLVQTTYCAASCSSFSISDAMIALDAATGEPNKAINAAYCALFACITPAPVSKYAPRTPNTGATTMRRTVPMVI